MHLSEEKMPSNKVGIAFIIVVLIVAGVIVSSKIEVKKPELVDLKNVDLVVERKTQFDFKAGDNDKDTLPDWLEEFYKTDPNNPDTDGDGTIDGEEISLDRDPKIPGPNDPLITRKDLINTDANFENFVAGTMTDKISVDLFSQYMILKKQGALKPEDEAKLVDELSKKVAAEASLKPKYAVGDLVTMQSTAQSLNAYGERVAQVALEALSQMDSYKNLKDNDYLTQMSKEHIIYASNLAQIQVPTVSQEVHLELINHIYRTGILFEALTQADADPLSSLVVISQYKTIQVDETQLYTLLGNYFKNNGIIFDTESTRNFWKNFEN